MLVRYIGSEEINKEGMHRFELNSILEAEEGMAFSEDGQMHRYYRIGDTSYVAKIFRKLSDEREEKINKIINEY